MKLLERSTRHLILAWTFLATAIAFAASPTQPAITAFRANPEPVLAGTPTTYAWTLTGATEVVACTLEPGDGAPTIPIPDCAKAPTTQHTYATPGTYTTTLHLKPAGPTATAQVTVDETRPANPKAGTLVWTYQTGFIYPSYLYSSPTIASDGTIIFGSGDRHIYALNPNGTLHWKRTGPQSTQGPKEAAIASGIPVATPSIGHDGTIYEPVMDDGLYALDPNGTLKWLAPIHDILDHAAAIAQDGTIYVPREQQLDAYHPNGQLAWSYKDPGHFTLESSPAVASDGTIYMAAEHDYVDALNPDGSLKWRFRTDGELETGPALGPDGTIYQGTIGRALYALNPDGTLKWRFPTGRRFLASPSIGPDGTIYVANDADVLYALNPDGTIKWHHSIEDTQTRIPLEHWIEGSPTIGNNGTIYIGSDGGNIYAFHADGTLSWTFHTPAHIASTPAIAPNGTLYITSTNGAFYAVHVTATGPANAAWPTLQNNNRRTGRAP